MAKKSKRRFKGAYSKLVEPIVLPLPPSTPIVILHTEEDKKQIKNEYEKWKSECASSIAKESSEKFHLLFDWYGIDSEKPDRWSNLAIRLAIDYIPGFSTAKPSGRHNEWDNSRLLKLYCDINKIRKENNNCSIQRACSLLAGRKNEYGVKQRTLYNKYSDAKKSIFVEWINTLLGNHGLPSDKIDSCLEELNSIINKHNT
jgi:hypothetical protein